MHNPVFINYLMSNPWGIHYLKERLIPIRRDSDKEHIHLAVVFRNEYAQCLCTLETSAFKILVESPMGEDTIWTYTDPQTMMDEGQFHSQRSIRVRFLNLMFKSITLPGIPPLCNECGNNLDQVLDSA